MKKIINLICITLFVFCLTCELKASNLQDAFDTNYLKKTGSEAGYNEAKTTNSIITTIIETVISFLGVIFLILMIYGGFLWMTAQGNDDQVKKSQNIIKAAVIGLIIVVSAYAVSWFVINKMSGATLKSTTIITGSYFC